MSLRWKLFRFLSAQAQLSPQAAQHEAGTSLFPSLTPAHGHQSQARLALLRRFSVAANRCTHAHSYAGLYAFALSRDAVQFFNLAVVDDALSLTSAPPLPPTPLQYTFSAHDTSVIAVRFVHLGDGRLPWFVTLGLDDTTTSVKIWAFKSTLPHANLASRPQSTAVEATVTSAAFANTDDHNVLQCIAVYHLAAHLRPTALAVQPLQPNESTISHLAVAFDDGSVTILHGDILRQRAGKTRVAPAPGEMTPLKPIVFLSYCQQLLYCVSQMSICTISPVLDSDRPAFRRHILDNLGVQRPQLCCTLEASAELIVAKPEALYFFNREGRGPCLAFQTQGDNASIHTAGNYVIQCSGTASITAYDVVNKLIAYRGKGVITCAFDGYANGKRRALLCLANNDLASGKAGSVLKMSEISLEERVNMLLKRGLYISAISLARAQTSTQPNQQKDMLMTAIRQYSEYLMSKDRYDEAAEQLVETIGKNVEPSWVISRLVEQSGLRSGLRHYLEALHAAGKADFVHTKVLITCYRHDRARGIILGTKASEKTTDEYVINVFSDVDWTEDQVDAAISLCRQAGLFKVAERVSRRRARYVQLACTLVEDLKQPIKTLELLRSLPDDEALKVLRACGRQLLVINPDRFVQYLSEAICRSTAKMPINSVGPTLRLDYFLPMFVDKPAWRAVFLDKLVKAPGGITTADAPKAWILLFESLACVDVAERLRPDGVPASVSAADAKSEYESISAVSTVEAEAVLTSNANASVKEKRHIGRRALRILQSRRSVIDLRAALEIAEQYGHEPCLQYLYEHLRMYKELGMCLRMSENGPALLRACRRHGDREPDLWIDCIRLFTPIAAKEEYQEDEQPSREATQAADVSKDDLASVVSDGTALSRLTRDSESEKGSAQEVLEEAMLALDRSGTLSPVEIIEIVTQACPDGAWGLVREYFERCTSTLRRDAIASEHASTVLETELKELRKEVMRLSDDAFTMNKKTCSMCDDDLTVPAVHFYCKHAYHASCLAPGGVGGGSGVLPGAAGERTEMWSEECPKCAPEMDGMVYMTQALQEKNTRHDEFFKKVKSSKDGFSSIIEFLELSPFI
ncbi:Vacuolar protein-sorting-associated protein 11-like [Gracilariopsis chorda]|uniref:Vacuolar protein-sorting-associated protein 11-like n=1 Tax=Gracilariopsis chorda TaxID=448386 RepID=A0A2V3ITZ8_9FLOR|nr:Vacuolar protein-sorting-associated protein 11-like [Gracilariopsis chorda]|eukprot:PXF45608.1 Vacuolar protein-sorting-associated protein 11-like [Gracilariopsis chorda]